MRLFVERAQAATATFDLTPANAQAVAEVCRRLDGIPLAIELAAARAGMLSAEQIARRPHSLASDTPRRARPRRGSGRSGARVGDWSYDLPSEPERRLFGRLSVFAGGWTIEEAAEEVGSGGGPRKTTS